MLSTIAFIFVLSVLVIVHEFGHFIVAKLCKVRVEIFSIGFGQKLMGFKMQDTEYRISMIPLGGYVKMSGDNPEEKRAGKSWEFLSKTIGQRAAIIFAGPAFNYIIAFLLFSLVFFIGMPNSTSKIGEVQDNYPAQQVGIQKGDRVIAIDGQTVELWGELSDIIHSKISQQEIVIEIQRNGQDMTLTVVPKVEKIKNLFGEDIKIGLIGIAPSDEVKIIRYGILKSIVLGAEQVLRLTQITCLALYRMITGQMSLRESVTGPVGIFIITGHAAKLGFVYLLQIMSMLSVSLAIINLFPLPVLDGGHLLFLLFEKIKGKPMSVKVQEVAMRIGISILVALMLFVFYNDFIRFGIIEKVVSFFQQTK